MKMIAAGLVIVAGLLAAPVRAEEPGRFSMTQIEDGFLRLDTQSGAMSICRRQDEQWACRSVPDDRYAMQEQITRLEKEKDELSAEIARLEALVGETSSTGGTDKRSRPLLNLPSEEEVDKFVGFIDRMMRKFKDMFNDLKREGGDGTPL